MPQAERRVQGPAILRSTLSASTGSFTAFLASRASCDGTLVSGHGDSATGASSPATYGRRIRASAWRQYQVARVDRRGELSVTPASTPGARKQPFPNLVRALCPGYPASRHRGNDAGLKPPVLWINRPRHLSMRRPA